MARPKLGETETERMQLKITTAEIEAIDDWRFANRVPSRSEAVRRLCQIGAPVDEELEEAVEHAKELRDAAELNWLADLQHLKENRDNPDRKMVEQIVDALSVSHDLFDRADRLYVVLVAAWNRIVPLLEGKSLKEAIEGSRSAVASSQAIFDDINRRDRQTAENSVILRVSQSQTPAEKAEYEALSEDEKDQWWERVMLEELGPFDGGGEK